jgi:hypothetical protein
MNSSEIGCFEAGNGIAVLGLVDKRFLVVRVLHAPRRWPTHGVSLGSMAVKPSIVCYLTGS